MAMTKLIARTKKKSGDSDIGERISMFAMIVLCYEKL